MEQGPQTSRERALDLIKLLVGLESNWQPTFRHYLWAIRIAVAATVLVIVVALLGGWLWDVLADYVKPKTATQRKDLANIFVLIAAGFVGALTAIAALGNLYISRRNLQQQRILEEERAQDDALQAYYKQMGDLLTEHDLKKTKPEDDVALLARAQTLTVVGRLEARRKGDLVRFLYGAGLIREDDTIVNLIGADLRRVDLSRADLRGAILRGANLSGADFRRAGLNSASLRYADLTYADVSGAGLGGADLEGADLEGAILSGPTGKTYEELERQAASLQFATMPNGQKYEDWRKSKERRAEDGQRYGSS